MAALELNIDALKFPDDGEAEKPTSNKSWSRVLSPLKSNFKMSSLDSSIPKEYLPTDYKTFLILRDFLQPGSAVSFRDAADRVVEVFPDGYWDLRSINTVCFELAEQIPYYHASQLKLARLLWLVGRNETRVVKSRTKDIPRAINAFYQHLREDLVDNNGIPGDDAVDPARYVNYQAFLANLMDVGVFLPGPTIALYAMRGAFEENHEKESPAIRDAWALGAAQWILWNGQGLFKLVVLPGDVYVPSEHGWKGSGQIDWKMEEKQQVTLKKWHTWKAEFRDIAGNSGFGEECRSVAGKAAEIMDVLERAMLF